MKWFQHNNNLRHAAEFSQMMDAFNGPLGYALGLIIWEVVAEFGDDNYKLPYSGKFGHSFWAREFRVRDYGKPLPGSIKEGPIAATLILQNAAYAEVIDPTAWQQEGIVYAPQLGKYVDQFHRDKKRKARKAAEAAAAAVKDKE